MLPPLLHQLDARDRALFERWAVDAARGRSRRHWAAITHLGGARCTLAAATLPMLAGGTIAAAARLAFAMLAVSHLLVQLVKRAVVRPRPSRHAAGCALIAEPDRFSFPSGHAAAAMAVAIAYSVSFPWIAAILLPLAWLVGMSRVSLGVHYPGDVFMGQLIALGTGLGIWGMTLSS